LIVCVANEFKYGQTKTGDWLPVPLLKAGIKGVSYRKYDSTICTYCSWLNTLAVSALMFAWKGEPFDDVEILTGKAMEPTPGKNKTILAMDWLTKSKFLSQSQSQADYIFTFVKKYLTCLFEYLYTVFTVVKYLTREVISSKIRCR